MGAKKRKIGGRGGGSARIELDMELLEGLARIGCTDSEIAGIIGISVSRFSERKQIDPELKQAYHRGQAELRRSIRHAQIQKGVGEKNPTMLIWLGKQYLGQTDKNQIDQNVKADVRDMTERELLEIVQEEEAKGAA